jgi:hypothetical protein
MRCCEIRPLNDMLRLQNQHALALLCDWLAEPDDLGQAWWANFEQDLRHHRLAFRDMISSVSSPFIAGPSARVTGGPAEGVTGER